MRTNRLSRVRLPGRLTHRRLPLMRALLRSRRGLRCLIRRRRKRRKRKRHRQARKRKHRRLSRPQRPRRRLRCLTRPRREQKPYWQARSRKRRRLRRPQRPRRRAAVWQHDAATRNGNGNAETAEENGEPNRYQHAASDTCTYAGTGIRDSYAPAARRHSGDLQSFVRFSRRGGG